MTTPPAAVPTRNILARIGAGSPLYVFAIYATGHIFSLILIGTSASHGGRGLAAAGGLVWLIGTITAYVIVTWFRDDDTVAAGFLFGICVGGGSMTAFLLLMIIHDRSLGGAILGFMAVLIPSAIWTAAAMALGMVLISFGRFLHPGIATPVPPPRRH